MHKTFALSKTYGVRFTDRIISNGMNKKLVVSQTVAFALLTIPALVFAHGGINDGHIEGDVGTEIVGVSALLQAFSPAWWGLLGVSTLLTTAISFGVWKFLHVPPIKKPDAKPI